MLSETAAGLGELQPVSYATGTVFRRRRHHARRPPQAATRSGSPAPAMVGTGLRDPDMALNFAMITADLGQQDSDELWWQVDAAGIPTVACPPFDQGIPNGRPQSPRQAYSIFH